MKSPKGNVPDEWKENGLCYGKGLTYAVAEKMIKAAHTRARKEGFLMSVAILDAGGHLLAFGRMDNSMLLSIQIALDKAYTAVYGKLPTMVWRDIFQCGEIPSLPFHERWTAFSGGFPIIKDGALLGGIGVSGATAYGDALIAREALHAGGFSIKDADSLLEELGKSA